MGLEEKERQLKKAREDEERWELERQKLKLVEEKLKADAERERLLREQEKKRAEEEKMKKLELSLTQQEKEKQALDDRLLTIIQEMAEIKKTNEVHLRDAERKHLRKLEEEKRKM